MAAPTKKRICPMLSSNRNEDCECLEMDCAWFRGTEEGGICCITDIAGWLGELHKVATGGPKKDGDKDEKKVINE
jgi:hypothetical protein